MSAIAWVVVVRLTAVWADAGDAAGHVALFQTPDGGIQPQAAIGADGAIHMVFFKGPPSAGDLYYTRTAPGATNFGARIRVNRQPGSAIAAGTIRGAQIALGRGGQVHVAWNGSNQAQPANPVHGSPMLYARLDQTGVAFEPQRNLMSRTSGLDGGGTVAADDAGNVYVAWHGRGDDAPEGEIGRRIWVSRSQDDGATFAPEQPAEDRERGACACCSTRALADRHGTLYILYRAAAGGLDRDMTLLTSRDHGRHVQGQTVHPWALRTCPMSSSSLADGGSAVLAAWETKGQVFFARIDATTLAISPPVAAPGAAGGRKHPTVAVNAQGTTLLAWTEGTGWERGGALAWQILDRDGRALGPAGRVEGAVPVWSLAAAVALPDGGFAVIH